MRIYKQFITFAMAIALGLAILGASPAGAQSSGELHVAENQFPTSLDGDVGFAGYSLMSYGIAEALMRVIPRHARRAVDCLQHGPLRRPDVASDYT